MMLRNIYHFSFWHYFELRMAIYISLELLSPIFLIQCGDFKKKERYWESSPYYFRRKTERMKFINGYFHIIGLNFNIILKCIYQNALEQWSKKLGIFSMSTGFLMFGIFQVTFIPPFKQRVIDSFKQKWFADMTCIYNE